MGLVNEQITITEVCVFGIKQGSGQAGTKPGATGVFNYRLKIKRLVVEAKHHRVRVGEIGTYKGFNIYGSLCKGDTRAGGDAIAYDIISGHAQCGAEQTGGVNRTGVITAEDATQRAYLKLHRRGIGAEWSCRINGGQCQRKDTNRYGAVIGT